MKDVLPSGMVERVAHSASGDSLDSKPFIRTVPPAITPVAPQDILFGLYDHSRGRGRKEFRTRILRYLGGRTAGTYTSFRRALAACLLRLRAERGETTVLVPSFCSSDYPKVIEGVGLELRRYDVDPQTLAADVDSLRDQSFDDVLAVITVNVLGYTSEMDTIETLCEAADTFLIEALGYGLGAEYRGHRLGTFGDCSVLNFQQGKPLPIGGGMVVSQNPMLNMGDSERTAVSPNPGVLSGYLLFSHPSLYGLYRNGGNKLATMLTGNPRPTTHPESKEDVTYSPPFNTLSNFQGSVGLKLLDRLPTHHRLRTETAEWYTEALSKLPGIQLLTPVDGLTNHPYVRYPLLVESSELRESLHQALASIGVQSSLLYDWPPIDETAYPGGAALQNQLLTIPTHPYVSATDRERTVRCIANVVGSEEMVSSVTSIEQRH